MVMPRVEGSRTEGGRSGGCRAARGWRDRAHRSRQTESPAALASLRRAGSRGRRMPNAWLVRRQIGYPRRSCGIAGVFSRHRCRCAESAIADAGPRSQQSHRVAKGSDLAPTLLRPLARRRSAVRCAGLVERAPRDDHRMVAAAGFVAGDADLADAAAAAVADTRHLRRQCEAGHQVAQIVAFAFL